MHYLHSFTSQSHKHKSIKKKIPNFYKKNSGSKAVILANDKMAYRMN